jgi:predicted RNA-binding protein with PUA-like domain
MRDSRPSAMSSARTADTRRRYWLVKTEPDSFSIDDLAKSPKKTTYWDGVRNYQARNFMREMRVGDGVLFYHSSTTPPAVVGIATVAREAYADRTALDPAEDHFDPKATPDNPIWEMVDIQLERIFARPLPIDELRGQKRLAKMELLRRGSRLSVQPVSEVEWNTVLELSQRPANTTPSTAKGAKKVSTPRKAAKRKK